MERFMLIRKTCQPTSDAFFFIRVKETDGIVMSETGKVTGQWIYSTTGLNAVPWRNEVIYEFMDEAAASAFTEIGGIPAFPVAPHHTEGAGYDIFQFEPSQFDPKRVMGSFGSQEREVVAYWLIKWAQHRGTWDGKWEFNELSEWYNDTGKWNDRHTMKLWHLDDDTWYSARGEFRERAGKCIERTEDGICNFTPVFVQRCLASVGRTWAP